MVSCLVFYLPADAGEKVGLAVTVLLALTVFLLMVAQSMPESSDSVPLLGEFIVLYCIAFVLYCIVFLLMVADSMPESSDSVPLLGEFIVLYCIVFCCIVLYSYSHGG